MWLWNWFKRRYQCQECGGWNKSMLGNLCLDTDTCPSWDWMKSKPARKPRKTK